MKTKKLKSLIILWLPITILITISLLNMKILANFQSGYQNYFLKQSIWFSFGFLIMFLIIFLKPKYLFKYSKYLYIFNLFLLIMVLFIGKSINGSKAWFNLYFFSFQPSELMKFTLTLYLSETLSKINNHDFFHELKALIKALTITLIPSILVFLEPDTGAIIIYLLIMLGSIIAFKIDKKWYIFLLSLLLIFISLFCYLYFFHQSFLVNLIGTSLFYRIDRLLSFINNNSYQLNRALIAIGSSSFFSLNNIIYIPEAQTDFIIALSIQNLGIISFIIIILCFIILNIYFIYNYFKTNNIKKKMFYASFIFMFIFAQIENIGMNLGLLPIIGLPLPFLSYGGTNIIVYFLFLAIIQKINLDK